MTDETEDEEDERKIVNLRGIAIISAFIVSSVVLYIQSSEWQANSP